MDFSVKHGGVGTAPGYGAGGGCVFNREQFIKSWEKAKPLIWDVYDHFKKINKIIGWEDFLVQYVMMIGGYEITQLTHAAQPWEEPNWKTANSYYGGPYEIVCNLTDINEIRQL